MKILRSQAIENCKSYDQKTNFRQIFYKIRSYWCVNWCMIFKINIFFRSFSTPSHIINNIRAWLHILGCALKRSSSCQNLDRPKIRSQDWDREEKFRLVGEKNAERGWGRAKKTKFCLHCKNTDKTVNLWYQIWVDFSWTGSTNIIGKALEFWLPFGTKSELGATGQLIGQLGTACTGQLCPPGQVQRHDNLDFSDELKLPSIFPLFRLRINLSGHMLKG